jgi:hypothetical protein
MFADAETDNEIRARAYRAQEAEFSEVKPEQKKSNVPATLQTFQLYRHDLCQGKNNNDIEKIAKELEIDKQLGLKAQCELTAEAALQKDIDELTSSKDYVQVSKLLLEKLFGIGKLRMICTWHTIKSFIRGMLRDAKTPLILFTIVLAMIYPMCVWSGMTIGKPASPSIVTAGLFVVLGWVLLVIFAIYGIRDFVENVKIKYDSLEVALDMKSLSSVDTRIPYGAKLKVLEAKETGIFRDFVYASPKFSAETKIWQNTLHINIDPAILGVTQDERMFMIVYWDIKKDKERIIKEIHQFRKFKIEG